MKTSDVTANLRDSGRQLISMYIESGQRIGQAMLELHERSTTWAKETALGPLFEAQRKAGKQMLDNSIKLARRAWGIIEEQGEELTSSQQR